MTMRIRTEKPMDYKTTEDIVQKAFEQEKFSDKKEHLLVAKIRKTEAFIPELSIVAVNNVNEIVGHILLSKINILSENGEDNVSLALAPVSVLPAYQRQGIGKKLIHYVLEKAKTLGYPSVVVLGHPSYYPKFGFQKASKWNIRAPFDVADELFMALELREDALKGVSGVVKYSEAFH